MQARPAHVGEKRGRNMIKEVLEMEARDAEVLVDLYRTLWERASDELDRAKRQLEDLKSENQVLRRVIDRQYERRLRHG